MKKSARQSRMWIARVSLIAALLALVFAGVPAAAQNVNATINGIITDPSGAGIAGARVTARDLDRGTVFPTVTANDGAYSLPRLPIGRYQVRVESSGFQSAVQSNIVLVLNQVAKVDLQLQVGSTSSTVEVTSAAPVLQTENTE